MMDGGRRYFTTNIPEVGGDKDKWRLVITYFEKDGCPEGRGTVLTRFDVGEEKCNRVMKGNDIPIVVRSWKYEWIEAGKGV